MEYLGFLLSMPSNITDIMADDAITGDKIVGLTNLFFGTRTLNIPSMAPSAIRVVVCQAKA
jgi:hypothetical protein